MIRLPRKRDARLPFRPAHVILERPIRVDKTIGGLICAVDETTTHVLREREVRAGEERFRMIAASMPHIVLEGDGSGSVTFLSEAYGAYTGQTAAKGHGAGWTAAIHPDDLAAAMERWQSATGQPYIAQFRYRRADNTFRWHSAHALAARCRRYYRTPAGQIQTVAIAHCDEGKHELAQQFVGRIHLDPNFHTGNAYTIRTCAATSLKTCRR